MTEKAKPTTRRNYIAMILDRSGSMDWVKDQTIKGFNEQVQQIKINASGDMETYVSLVSFNGDVFEHLWNKPAEELLETSGDDYRPDGSTAMRDAIGYVINKFRQTTDVDDENNSYLLIILSDGQENASKHFTTSALREMIDSCQKSGKWTFTYLGCGEEYLQQVANDTGISLSNMASYNATKGGTVSAMRCAAMNTGKYLRQRSVDADYAACDTFYSESIGAAASLEDVEDVDLTFSSKTDSPMANYFGSGTSVDWSAVDKDDK